MSSDLSEGALLQKLIKNQNFDSRFGFHFNKFNNNFV